MKPKDLRYIHTTKNSCRDSLPWTNMSLKLPQYFYLLMGTFFGCYFQVRSPYYQETLCKQNTYSSIVKVKFQVWESQTRRNINTNHSYHQHSSSLASLNWSKNKVRFSFNQPNWKRWSTRLVDVIKHLPHKAFLLWQLTRRLANQG